MHKKSVKVINVIGVLLFIAYLAGMVYFLFFAESMGRLNTDRGYCYNLEPFKEIKRFLVYHNEVGSVGVILNLFGNILCFVPFGLFLPFINEKMRSGLKVALLSLEFSLIVETLQLIFKVGSFDVDDLILNTLGGIIGYVMYKAVMKTVNTSRRKKNRRK